MDERTEKLVAALQECCPTPTAPVAVKLARPGETPPGRVRRPVQNLKRKLAVCQGMSLARTFGWNLAFAKEDHACPLPRVFMGHIDPQPMLDGTIAGFYQEDPESMRAMEASYPRWPQGEVQEVWLSPLAKAGFVPDLAVVYGNPAQVLALIQGANFGKGPGIRSVSSGRYGCSAWLAGVLQADECTYLVPGPGERIFAGTQDHEMSFAVPCSKFDDLAAGLRYVRGHGAYKLPVPNMAALAEPQLPEKYYSIDAE